MAKHISAEQIEEQRRFMAGLLEENNNFAVREGRRRLAHTETYGCQQNENDTERIRGMLHESGFSLI